MKNIHILPTDKKPTKGDLLLRHIWKNHPKLECKSWWRYNETITIDNFVQYTTLNGSFRDITSSFKVHNIYITNSEEIKEGDIVYSTSQDYNIQKVSKELVKAYQEVEHYKKIILTTDQDLIKDGVQAIPDDFLEWFVAKANDSGKPIDIIETKLVEFEVDMGLGDSCVEYGSYYKIIIPKEEPDYTALLQRVGTRQETLEEVAERFYGEKEIVNDYDISGYLQSAFLTGAKWQQERSYSEEELKAYGEFCVAEFNGFASVTLNEKVFEKFKKK